MPEKILYDRGPSRFRNGPFSFSAVVVLCLVSIAGIAAYFWWTGPDRPAFLDLPSSFGTLCALWVIAVLTLVTLGWWWLTGKATRLTITDEKSTLRRGIFSRYISEVYHVDVRNIQLTQTVMQRIFDVGTIGIDSAGQGGMEIHVEGIPDPDGVKAIIDQHRRAKED